jgi:hypothetical protein
VINHRNVPAAGEAVNDGQIPPPPECLPFRQLTGARAAAQFLPGIGENPDKTSLFPRISKAVCAPYDQGTATES